MKTTRELIRDFSLAFDRPVNESWTDLTVTARLLLGKLLFEEVVEYITEGLGLSIAWTPEGEAHPYYPQPEEMTLALNERQPLNPVEVVDGLADVNVVAHFAAHWHGFNLDRATEIVHESNMSKLGEDGKPIINGETPGYRTALETIEGTPYNEEGFDPSKPIGKILKGPRFHEPTEMLRALILHHHNRSES